MLLILGCHPPPLLTPLASLGNQPGEERMQVHAWQQMAGTQLPCATSKTGMFTPFQEGTQSTFFRVLDDDDKEASNGHLALEWNPFRLKVW